MVTVAMRGLKRYMTCMFIYPLLDTINTDTCNAGLICTMSMMYYLFVGSDEDDSNLLTSEHDVISGVLREEFGPSYDTLYGPRPQTSRCISFDKNRTMYDACSLKDSESTCR